MGKNNKSNNVFKRYFRSTRINASGDDDDQSKPITHIPNVDATTQKTFVKNIETGEPGARTSRCGPFKMFVVWDNNFSLKLLGSKSAIEKEEEKRLALSYFVIHPCCRFKIMWDFMLLLVLMLNVILLPVSIAFYPDPIHPGWLTFNIISDIFFFTDIGLSFWTGTITDDNQIIIDIKKIRKSYAKKWLLIDAIALLPFDYVAFFLFEISASASRSIFQGTVAFRFIRPIAKLLGLLKLFRVVKFLHALSKWEETLSSVWSIRPILNFMFGMLLLCHWNGCIQFLIAFVEGFPPNSWVALSNLQDSSPGVQYGYALFKAMSHMLCIGYGQQPPKTTVEIWVTIVSMLVGATLYAMFIGHITNLIYSATSSTRLYSEKLKLVEEYMRYHKIPQQLKIKVRNYFYHRYHGRLFNEKTMLKELSHVLEEEITRYNYRDVLKMVPMFKEADEEFLDAIVSMFTYEVFLEGDMIISTHTHGSTMYFIQHGEAQVINRNGQVVRVLVDGDYFGEIGLLMNEHRQGSVKATTVCFMFCLSRDDLHHVLEQFPALRTSLEARARERLQELYLSENRPLETILALFSDPGLTGPQTESEHSDISDFLNSKGDDSDADASGALFNCASSILNALETPRETPLEIPSTEEKRKGPTPSPTAASSSRNASASSLVQYYI